MKTTYSDLAVKKIVQKEVIELVLKRNGLGGYYMFHTSCEDYNHHY